MGTFAKRLGQLAARSLESESSNILKTGRANKRGLSLALDKTLKEAHDMRSFGLGTAASLASRARYGRFTGSMFHVYSAMESALDASASPSVSLVWSQFGPSLRRASALAADLAEVDAWPASEPTAATRAYVERIRAAASDDNDTRGGRLLGHLYTRYFADLFGGQALAAPTRWALDLSPASPRHYDFGEFGETRRESIEAIYAALNAAGDALDDERRAAVVDETRAAFAANVAVYREEGGLAAGAARGAANVCMGFARARFGG